MALGPANAPVTITEYASMTCPHCAAFNENVFPKIKSEYIDTGKVRYVFREFPLDIKAAAGSMLARCIAKDDAGKYFAVIDMLFKQQSDWVMKNTTETLTRIGKQAGLSQQAVEDCLKDQALLDKIAADQKFASEVLKVNSTPTFFINGEMVKGETSFEEFDKQDQIAAEELIDSRRFACAKRLRSVQASRRRPRRNIFCRPQHGHRGNLGKSLVTSTKALGKAPGGGCPPAPAVAIVAAIRAARSDSPTHRHCLLWYCPGREIRALPTEHRAHETHAPSPPRFQVVR